MWPSDPSDWGRGKTGAGNPACLFPAAHKSGKGRSLAGDELGLSLGAQQGKTQASLAPWRCTLPPRAPIPLGFSVSWSHSEAHHRSHYPSTTPTRAGAVGTGAYPRPRGAATMAEPEQASSSSAPGRHPSPVPAASLPPPGPCFHPGGPSSALLTRSSDPPPGSSRSP